MPIIGSDGAIHRSAFAARSSPRRCTAKPSAPAKSTAHSPNPIPNASPQAFPTMLRCASDRSAHSLLTVMVSPALASMENSASTVIIS